MDSLDRVSGGKLVRCQAIAPVSAFLNLTASGHALQRLEAKFVIDLAMFSDLPRGLYARLEGIADGLDDLLAAALSCFGCLSHAHTLVFTMSQ
jgi:hypothetical protein